MRRFALLALLLAQAAPAYGAGTRTLMPREPLTAAVVEELLDPALAPEVQGRLQIEIEAPPLPLNNQSAYSTEIRLDGMRRDVRTGRFSASIRGATADGQHFTLPLRGRALELALVPVLNRPLAAGEVVAAGDVDWLELPANRLPRGALADGNEIIGAEARRRLVPRRVLTARDLGAPLLVRRGRPVRLVYAAPGLTIATVGTALDDGPLGALVGVTNTDSRRQVQGSVTAADEVTVQSSAPLIR